jgi:hypothetical protein
MITPELSEKVEKWLLDHPGENQTTFALSAVIEKLRREGIVVRDDEVIYDGRVRRALEARIKSRNASKKGTGGKGRDGTRTDRPDPSGPK